VGLELKSRTPSSIFFKVVNVIGFIALSLGDAFHPYGLAT